MNFDMFALAAIHAGGILGAVIGAWRSAVRCGRPW